VHAPKVGCGWEADIHTGLQWHLTAALLNGYKRVIDFWQPVPDLHRQLRTLDT
jgi:hypothetical protein